MGAPLFPQKAKHISFTQMPIAVFSKLFSEQIAQTVVSHRLSPVLKQNIVSEHHQGPGITQAGNIRNVDGMQEPDNDKKPVGCFYQGPLEKQKEKATYRCTGRGCLRASGLCIKS